MSQDTGRKRDLARQGLLLADRASDAARYESVPRVHALIALRRAYAASVLGDGAAFRAAITRAHRELDRGPADADPEWVQFVTPAEISGAEAGGYRSLDG